MWKENWSPVRKARSSFIVLNYFPLWIPFKYCCCFFVKACESVFCHWYSLARMITKACPLLMHHVWVFHVTLSPSAFFWGKVNSKFCLSLSLWVLQLPAHRPMSYPSHCCPRARTPSLPLSSKQPMSWSEQGLDIATKQSLCPLPTVQAILSSLSSKSKPFFSQLHILKIGNWKKRIMHLCYLSCVNYISGWSNSSKWWKKIFFYRRTPADVEEIWN